MRLCRVQPAAQASVQTARQVADQRAAERATGRNVQTAVSAEQPAKQDNVNMAAAQLHVLQNQMPADKSNASLNATKLPSAQVKEEPVQSAASSAIICAEGYPPGQNTQAASSGEQRARQESATELLDPQVQQKRIQFAVPIATVIAARDVLVHDPQPAVGASGWC